MNSNQDGKRMTKGSYRLNSIIRIGNKAFFVPINKRILVEYSFVEEKEIALYELPEFSYEGLNPFLDIVFCCGKIVLIPNHAKIFIVFDINSKMFRTIEIPMKNIKCHPWGYFSKAYVYKEKIYVVGHIFPGIVRIDTEKCSCEVVLNMTTSDMPVRRFIPDSILHKETILLLSAINNSLIIFSLDTHKHREIKINDGNDLSYISLACKDDIIWMANNNLEIVCFKAASAKENALEALNKMTFLKSGKPSSDEIAHSIVLGNHLLIGTDDGSVKVFKIEDDKGLLTEIDIVNSREKYCVYNFFDQGDGKVCFLDNNSLKNYRIDIINKIISEIKVASNDEKYLALSIIKKKKILTEMDADLAGFLAYIVNN